MMNKDQVIKALTHPLFIGLILTSIILVTVSPDISKYKMELEEKRLTPGIRQIYFSDLNGDHTSEEINIDNTPTLLKVMLLDGTKFMAQYNLSPRPVANEFFYAGDYNNDGFKEIYLLTLNGDSVLLSIIDPIVKEDFILNERLIFYSDTTHFVVDIPEVDFLGLVDFRDGRGKTLLFSICTGYSKQPGTIFRYDISLDELMVSPVSGASIYHPFLCNLSADSVPEILLQTSATGNYQSDIPYSDQSAWLMALNEDLEFVFDPIEFPGYPSSLLVSSFPSDTTTTIIALHHYYGSDTINSGLYLFNNQGNILRSKSLDQVERAHYYIATGEEKTVPVIYLLNATRGTITVLNKQLKVTDERSIPPLFKAQLLAKIDIEGDGNVEYIFCGQEKSSFVIFRNNLTHPLIVNLKESTYPKYFTTLLRNGRRLLYSQFEDAGYITSYEKNPLYYLRIPLIVLLYALVSALIFLIYRIQQYRANMQFQTQKKISELQILALKNQIDPHFTFNILNSMGSLYSKGDEKGDAYNVFVKYSKLLRHTIQNSDKISVSMEEELDFVKTYIDLEQFRSNYSFSFELIYEDNIDLGSKIPRMLIYSFVENSLKHGIRQLPKNGQLCIKIYHAEGAHFISVKDNGPGLQKPSVEKIPSTGKGLRIIDELITLFNQLEGTRISYSLKDSLSGNRDNPGTVVLIRIPD